MFIHILVAKYISNYLPGLYIYVNIYILVKSLSDLEHSIPEKINNIIQLTDEEFYDGRGTGERVG